MKKLHRSYEGIWDKWLLKITHNAHKCAQRVQTSVNFVVE